MRDVMSRAGKLALVAALALGAYALFAPDATFAGKGGGKGGGGNPPPPCGCAEVIHLPGGVTCVLEGCGSDCVYVCNLP